VWGKREGIKISGGGNLRKRDHLEELDVEGRIILKYIFKD